MEGRTCGNVVVMISASAWYGRMLLPLQILDGAGPEIDEVRRHASGPIQWRHLDVLHRFEPMDSNPVAPRQQEN
jgi:hypothetical protein